MPPRPAHNVTEPAASPLTATISISVDRELVLARLRAAAAVRDVAVDHLVGSLIEVIAAEGLVGAVLDDGCTAEAAPKRRRGGRPLPPG